MNLDVNALVGIAHLIPIALTLRKVYAPTFDVPEPFTAVLAKLDAPAVRAARTRRTRPLLDLV